VDTGTLTPPFRVLVKDEVAGENNGIFLVTSVGGLAAKWTATRTTDADTSDEVTTGMQVPVETGTENGGLIFRLATAAPITLNTTPLSFVDARGLATTAPADVTKAAAEVGTSTEVARADHKHDVSTAAPGAVAIGDAAAEGVATSLARSDHTHSVAGAVAVDVALANAEGVATTVARSDHAHNSLNQRFQLTLVAGTATKAAGVTVTANTRATVTLVTPGAGVSGTRYAVAYSIGAPGAGSITVTAKDSAAGDNTVITDVSVLDVVCVEAAAV